MACTEPRATAGRKPGVIGQRSHRDVNLSLGASFSTKGETHGQSHVGSESNTHHDSQLAEDTRARGVWPIVCAVWRRLPGHHSKAPRRSGPSANDKPLRESRSCPQDGVPAQDKSVVSSWHPSCVMAGWQLRHLVEITAPGVSFHRPRAPRRPSRSISNRDTMQAAMGTKYRSEMRPDPSSVVCRGKLLDQKTERRLGGRGSALSPAVPQRERENELRKHCQKQRCRVRPRLGAARKMSAISSGMQAGPLPDLEPIRCSQLTTEDERHTPSPPAT